MHLKLSVTKTIKGAATAPDSLIQGIVNNVVPLVLKSVIKKLIPEELCVLLEVGAVCWGEVVNCGRVMLACCVLCLRSLSQIRCLHWLLGRMAM